MVRHRLPYKSVSLLFFAVAFLPLSLHWDSFRFLLDAAKKWYLLLSSGGSLSDATRGSFHLLVSGTNQKTAFVTVHRVSAASPTCTITAPTGGATVSGASTSVTANATSSKTITNVQFRLDGSVLGSADTSSPYGITWDTTAESNGTHSLSCTTTNQYGETTTSTPVSVTVSNDSTPPVRSSGSPSTSLPSGTTGTTLSLSTNENATCKYSLSSGTAYASMSNTFGTTGSTSHSTAVSSLVDGGSYGYYVRCQDGASNPNSDDYLISFSVLSPSGDIETPTAPSGLIATPTTSTVSLTWNASTDNIAVTGYKVFRNSVEIATSATTSYTDTGLTPSTAYAYEVAAYDAAANVSSHSGTTNTTTSADTDTPSTPSNLIATATSDTTVSLTWDASTDNIAVTGYKVFRNSVEIGTTTGNLYNDAGLTAMTSYDYEVLAYDGAGLESAHSTTATVSTSATPAPVAWEESKTVYKKPPRVLKQNTSVIARGEVLVQSGRRFAKNAPVRLYFQKSGDVYYPPLLVKTDSKGKFSVLYTVNRPAGAYKWYAVEVRTGKKTKKRTYTVYDPKKEARPTAPKKTSSSSSSYSTHSS